MSEAPRVERVRVEHAAHVAHARRLAVEIGYAAGMTAAEADGLALAATELAENLHRHAVGGELVVRAPEAGRPLVLVALDRGPGVARFADCLVDGYTTAGTLGTGLGAVGRRAVLFDAVSEPGRGTVVVAGFTVRGVPPARTPFDIGVHGQPVPPEVVNGDAAALVVRGGTVVALLADGLGHGPSAAAASGAAVDALHEVADLGPAGALTEINRRLAGTRGAAVTLATLDAGTARDGGEVSSAGLGNVSLLVAAPDGSSKRVVTTHGTAGARPRVPIAEQHTSFPRGGLLVLHSDGLTTRWGLEQRAELLGHRAEVIAAALWRDHSRGSDDSLVVVVRGTR